MRTLTLVSACLLLSLAWGSSGQAARLAFDGVVAPGTHAIGVAPYSEEGYTLTNSLVGVNSDGIFDPGAPFNNVHNGTANFGWCGGCDPVESVVLTLTRDGGGAFNLLSVQASNLLVGAMSPGEQLIVTGNLVGGGTVVQSLGLVQDVMTVFNLGPGFTNLASVEFRGSLAPGGNHLAIDDIIVNPEPGTAVLLGGGLVGLGLRGRVRRRRRDRR